MGHWKIPFLDFLRTPKNAFFFWTSCTRSARYMAVIGGVGPAFQGHGVLWLRFSLCTVFCHVCRLMLPSVMIGVVRLCDHSLPWPTSVGRGCHWGHGREDRPSGTDVVLMFAVCLDVSHFLVYSLWWCLDVCTHQTPARAAGHNRTGCLYIYILHIIIYIYIINIYIILYYIILYIV